MFGSSPVYIVFVFYYTFFMKIWTVWSVIHVSRILFDKQLTWNNQFCGIFVGFGIILVAG